MEGEQISVWFNKDGMYAAHGTSAFEHTEVHLSWSAVESVIRGQIEAGSYIDSNEAYLADQFVRKELADMLFFISGTLLERFQRNWGSMDMIIRYSMNALRICCPMGRMFKGL
ncbi:MAG: hypothetical protein ACLTDT_01870 [Clostridium sp.]